MSSNDTATCRTTTIAPIPPELPKPSASAMFANRKTVELTECKWAAAFPEIQKACFLARVCPILSPKSCRMKDIKPILQEGPTCGLAAISMLLAGHPTSEELLQLARHRKYTRNGEMFSADALWELLHSVVTEATAALSVRLVEGRLYDDSIIQVLRNGGCLLVPYDPDFNHGPCLKNGHKAHWALIIGYLIDDSDQFFVLARHGKTRNVAIWSLKALSASNANLIEFEQPKGYPNAEFILPDGGLGGALGLKNKCIIVDGVQADDIVVRYDPDFNHGPCLKNGHKAHWALIVGYLIDDSDQFFVLARHGKTRNVAIWSLKALSASNANLIEFEQPKGYPNAEFILPDGGLGGALGLKNKCIIVDGVQADDIVVR